MFISEKEKTRISNTLVYLLDRDREREIVLNQFKTAAEKRIAELEQRITELENCYTEPKPVTEAEELVIPAEYVAWRKANREMVRKYRDEYSLVNGPIEENDKIYSSGVSSLLKKFPKTNEFYESCPTNAVGDKYQYVSTTINGLTKTTRRTIRFTRDERGRIMYSRSDTARFFRFMESCLTERIKISYK